MRADGGVDAAAGGLVGKDNVMQPLTHAMQALEFVVERRDANLPRQMQDGSYGMGVVGGELRVDAVGQGQKLAGIGDVADIGRLFAGEDREGGQAKDLRALHLGVPIGAFHEADHDLAIKAGGKGMQPVDHRPCPAAISLHDDAEPIPALQRGVGEGGLDDFQR